MLDLGLTNDEEQALYRTLRDSHMIDCDVHVLDFDHNHKASLADMMVSGAVQVDTTGDVTRALDLSLIDEHDHLKLEQGNPNAGSAYPSKMLHATYGVFVDEVVGRFPDWLDIPVFTGPLHSFERQGKEVSITAQGKESLLRSPWTVTDAFNLAKRAKIGDAIQKAGRNMGETHYSIPELKQRLARAVGVHPGAEVWTLITDKHRAGHTTVKHRVTSGKGKHKKSHVEKKQAKGLVESLEGGPYMAFFNGPGDLCVRHTNRPVVWHFREGLDIVELPDTSYGDEFFNHVEVHGGAKPKGKGKDAQNKGHAHGAASLPASHPLSPASLKRGGHDGKITKTLHVANLKSHHQCKERAKEELRRVSKMGLQISMSVLPIPMLEESDRVHCTTDLYDFDIQLMQFSIALTADDPMTLGRTERQKPELHKNHGDGGAGPGGPGATGHGPHDHHGHHNHHHHHHRHRHRNHGHHHHHHHHARG